MATKAKSESLRPVRLVRFRVGTHGMPNHTSPILLMVHRIKSVSPVGQNPWTDETLCAIMYDDKDDPVIHVLHTLDEVEGRIWDAINGVTHEDA